MRDTYCCTKVEKIDVSMNALNSTSWNPCWELSGLKKVKPMKRAEAIAKISFAQMYTGSRQYCWNTRRVTCHSWLVKGMAYSRCVLSCSSSDEAEALFLWIRPISFWISLASLLSFQTTGQS